MCPWTSVFTSLSLHCYLYKIADQSVLTLKDIYERWHEVIQKYLASCLTRLRTQGIIAAVCYKISSHSPWSFVGLLTWPSFIWLACLNWVEKGAIVTIKLGQTSFSRHLSWEYANWPCWFPPERFGKTPSPILHPPEKKPCPRSAAISQPAHQKWGYWKLQKSYNFFQESCQLHSLKNETPLYCILMTKVKYTHDRNSNTTNVWGKQWEPRSHWHSSPGGWTLKNLPGFLKDLFNIIIIIILQASSECLMYQANENPFHHLSFHPHTTSRMGWALAFPLILRGRQLGLREVKKTQGHTARK